MTFHDPFMSLRLLLAVHRRDIVPSALLLPRHQAGCHALRATHAGPLRPTVGGADLPHTRDAPPRAAARHMASKYRRRGAILHCPLNPFSYVRAHSFVLVDFGSCIVAYSISVLTPLREFISQRDGATLVGSGVHPIILMQRRVWLSSGRAGE